MPLPSTAGLPESARRVETVPPARERLAPPADAARPPQPRRPGILLLDDDSFILGIQSRLLRSMGYQNIITAGGAEAALRMLQREPDAIDVIVCDLNMPAMDGIEFLQAMNANAYCGSVILLSGEGARIMHTVQRLLSGGRLRILGALEKPASREALGAVLARWQPDSAPTPVEPAFCCTVAELHAASREGQWVLHYQPKVSLATGEVAGMEALIRWRHPLHGLVYPDSFIGLAEEHGKIDFLTEWVLHDAVTQLARWRRDRLNLKLAINVSMDNLGAPGFAQRVNTIMADSLVSPQDVTLEITESRLMSQGPGPLENLVRLRMRGFGLSVDDFGTGHSSLAQLRDVPFTELKIDRGFVQGARHNQFIRPILEGSLGIAKRLGMQSVAEGVETEDDWHLLRDIGCDLAQGYFIGRPMAADQVPGWLAAWHRRQLQLTGQ